MESPGSQRDPSTASDADAPVPAASDGKAKEAGQAGSGPAQDSGIPAPSVTLATPMATTVAIGVLVVYIAALWLLFVNRGDKSWDRMVYLLSGFEAIVFVAVGAIFGTSVQRASVTAAQAQAQQARAEAAAARNRASAAAARGNSGEALAAGIRSIARSSKGVPASPGSTSLGDRHREGPRDAADAPDASRPDLALLVGLADELFPPGR